MPRLPPCLLAWALLGCSPSLARVELPLPPSRSVVLILVLEDGTRQVQAIEFSGETPPYLTVPSTHDAQVFALSYLCSLAAVGLSPGPARLDDESGTPLPLPSMVKSGQIRAGLGSAWLEERELPAVIRDLRLARQEPRRCLDFDQRNEPLPSLFQSAALLGTGQLAVALLSGLYVYDLPSLTLRTHWELPFAPEPRGAAAASDGTAYFAGATGAIDVVTPELVHTALTGRTGTTADPNGRVRVALPTAGPVNELFIATEQGRVERWDGTAWHLLFEDGHPVSGNQADVAWIGPGRVLAVGILPTDLIELVDGQATTTKVLDRGGKLSRILLHPTGGRLFFTADGRLVTPKGGGTFAETALAAMGQRSVTSAIATEHGFLASAYVGGTIAQFDFEQGECKPTVVDLDVIETILSFGGQHFVFGKDYSGLGRAVVLTPTHLPEQCR